MLFAGGVFVGIALSVVIYLSCLLLWKKFLRSKINHAIVRAELKAIEARKEKNK